VLEGLPNLEVTGWREHRDALRLIATVDAVLHASRWEGMPNALLEAMALAKPVVVSDVVGTRDVVEDGVDALLVREMYAAEPYLAALERLAQDPALRDAPGPGRVYSATTTRASSRHGGRRSTAKLGLISLGPVQHPLA